MSVCRVGFILWVGYFDMSEFSYSNRFFPSKLYLRFDVTQRVSVILELRRFLKLKLVFSLLQLT
jgi:hypothetical protein